ncbi:MAG: hypothetical protein EHM18_15110 [Acidobacteria bacterium]|nr:MAG: hypothetical protein EHM18_15110 [Acidobacteriota bacterium]
MPRRPGGFPTGVAAEPEQPGSAQDGEPGGPEMRGRPPDVPGAPDMAPAASLLTMLHRRALAPAITKLRATRRVNAAGEDRVVQRAEPGRSRLGERSGPRATTLRAAFDRGRGA